MDGFDKFTMFMAENATEIKIFTGVFVALAGVLTGGAAIIPALVLGFAMLFDTIETKEEGVTGLGIIFDELSMTFGELFGAIGRAFKPLMQFLGFIGEESKDGAGLSILVFLIRGLAMALTAPIKVITLLINGMTLFRDAVYALFAPASMAEDAMANLDASFHGFEQSIVSTFKPLLQFLNMFMDVNGYVESLGYTLFEKQYASNFLEGIGKIANAFSEVGLAVLESLNPFNMIIKVIDSVGNLFDGIIGSATGFFTALSDPMAAENIMRIGDAITAIPTRKTLEFAGAMVATTAAATATAANTAVSAATQTVTSPSKQSDVYRMEIPIILDGKQIDKKIIELIGGAARDAAAGRALA